MTYTPAKQCTNLNAGRPSGGLAIFFRSINNLTCETTRYTDRIIGLTLETNYFKYVILNVNMSCKCRTLKSLHEYQSCVSCISNFISEEAFDELIVTGDMNFDPKKGRFFHKLGSTTTRHFLHWTDIGKLPSLSNLYVSHNRTASTSWMDHILCSNSKPCLEYRKFIWRVM